MSNQLLLRIRRQARWILMTGAALALLVALAPAQPASADVAGARRPLAAAADGFLVESLRCSAGRFSGGSGVITCTGTWVGGNGPFTPMFSVNPQVGGVSVNVTGPRSATFQTTCFRSREYTVTLVVRDDSNGTTTPAFSVYVPCGNQ